MVAFSVVTLLVLHALVFFFHAFVVFRYDSLYAQIQSNGATIQMPEDFLRVQKWAQERSFFSRPDILAEEIGLIHSGTRSMIHQYKNDLYRLHDRIVQHIKYLTLAAEIGQELVYPEQEKSLEYASMLQIRLDNVVPGDINALVELSTLSQSMVDRTRYHIEYAQKKLVYQDILAFKHEMLLIADMYRLNPPEKKTLDIKKFWNEFGSIFSREVLKTRSYETLTDTLERLKNSTQEYQKIAHEIRLNNRERRAAWVEAESKKWTVGDIMPPTSPLPDAYQLIHVSLAKQMMYVYEDNELILSTPITSGRNNFETIRGTFRIYTKQRGKIMKSPFPEEEYELWVDYWMWFSGAYGIHDACNSTDCWRTKFGGGGYVYNGSHGCVNTPYNAVRFIYNWAKVGTTVYVR
jgi:lipoprotein-anchoring transpeptidase ErfK/SrfK